LAGAARTAGIVDLDLGALAPALHSGLGPETLGWFWLAGLAVLLTFATARCSAWLVRERLAAAPH